MSNKTKDILDEILDVEESTAELVEKKPDTLIVKRDNTLDDVDSDYKYQRENFYNLTNALYVGSTAELQKLLKKDKEK